MDRAAPNPTGPHRPVWPEVALYGLLITASLVWSLPLAKGLGRWGRGDWDQFSFRYGTARRAWLDYHQLPTWNPYVNGGNVLIGHPHSPALSPLFVPVLLLGVPVGLRVQVAMFVVLGTAGMAALLRRVGVSRAGAFLGAVLLMLSSHFVLHITEGHQEWCALGLMPWVAWSLVRSGRDRRWIVGAALFFALALLHGSIYVAAVFAPLMGICAALESLRRRRFGPLGCYLGAMALAAGVSAVVLVPRLEFVRANPRPTDRYEQIAWQALPRMLLDPRQAAIYRATRDVRNPPYDELARMLPDRAEFFRRKAATREWHRLEVTLSTTSDWTDLRFENFPYILRIEDPQQHEPIPPHRLDSLPLSTEGLALKNPQPEKREVSVQAVMYVRLPRRGDLRFVITRGNAGRTRLVVRSGKVKLLDVVHQLLMPGSGDNRREFTLPREALLFGVQRPVSPAPRRWYRLEATLHTTADWCALRLEDVPYLFAVESPAVETRKAVPLVAAPLSLSHPAPSREPLSQRALLFVACAEGEKLRAILTQGRLGTSRLELRTLDGRLLPADCQQREELGGQKTYEYTLSAATLARHLAAVERPLRWRLDELGMVYDWHEYGCYLTWIGLVLAVVGVAAAWRRAWPLWLTGLMALWIALGAGAPLNVWGLMKYLPLYGSLQVSARFLMGLVFVLAVAAGLGLDAGRRAVARLAGRKAARLLAVVLVLAVYGELAALGWNLLGDIFVCPPRRVPYHRRFAQRYTTDQVRYSAMYSAHYAYMQANSGVLRQYENIAIPRGRIRLEGSPDYRGEAWLAAGRGKARIRRWTMARVVVELELTGPDTLVLNQNHFVGWKARVDSGNSHPTSRPVERGKGDVEGLVTVAVEPGDRFVEIYYLPDSVLWGGLISAVSLLGTLAVLLAGKQRLEHWFQASLHLAARVWPGAQTKAGRLVFWLVLCNLPFAFAHPAAPLVRWAPARALAIGCVLLAMPGLAWSWLLGARGKQGTGTPAGVLLGSVGTFVGLLLARHAWGGGPSGVWMWNATWLVTNFALVGAALRATVPPPALLLDRVCWRVSLPLFVAAFGLFFAGATRVVPPMQDHDLDIQGPGYGLLVRLQPRVVNDRGLLYYFAHPLLLNGCQAAAFMYWGQLDYLAHFDQATERVIQAESGRRDEPLLDSFRSLPDGRLARADSPQRGGMLHRVVGLENGQYIVQPPLSGRGTRIGARELETQLLYDDYYRDPRRLESRTVNMFLGAMAAAMLGWWISRLGAEWWQAMLLPLVYATSPEVFVRSSYGGYYAISALSALLILVAAWRRADCKGGGTWRECFWTGLLAGFANNKLLPLIAALAVWEFVRPDGGKPGKRLARAAVHPVVLGFLVATGLFVAYGALIDWSSFCADYFQHHMVDRLLHHNPLGYQGYPTIAGLWWELSWHTGYLLLPLGAVALGVLCWQDWKGRRKAGAEPTSLDLQHTDQAHEDPGEKAAGMPALWAGWCLLSAVVFSLIDWRQTKHLTILILPLLLAVGLWMIRRRPVRTVLAVVLAAVLVWNIGEIWLLGEVFTDFKVTPAW